MAREEIVQQHQRAKAEREKELYDQLTPAQKRRWHEKEEKKRKKRFGPQNFRIIGFSGLSRNETLLGF